MALSNQDVDRVKRELGYNVLGIGALPYIDHVVIFDVVQQNVGSDTTTTSSTTVTASSSGPVPVALTLASATGFAPLARVVVDVDARQEVATVQSVSGATITLQLALAHSGTYPVTVEGAESLVRELLRQLAALSGYGGTLTNAASQAGVKKVDEIEFFGAGAGGGGSRIETLEARQMRLRDELSAVTGIPNMWRMRAGANQGVALY